ncbi:MAG TPA: helix-turn-helix domain-containing protein [Gammaproteobacteria bacterium]|nr:helix-turn-helix domain-containing protein [Gammaproteobacteria bacterium]
MSALMAEQEQNEGIQLAVPGLGDRLKAARMACNLDLGRLAARIHLTADVVDALERDDYSDMPARVFVRGYVRNYARAVNLPTDSVLAQFDRLWPDEETSISVSESPRLAADARPRRRRSRPGLWLALLVLAGLGAAWWQGYLDDYLGRGQPAEVAGSAPAPAEIPAPAPKAEGEGATALAPLPTPEDEKTAEAPAAPPVSGSGELPLPPPPAVAESPAPVAPSPPAASEAPATVTAPASDAAAASVSEAAAPAEPQAAPTPPPPPQVVVRFRRNSWVDIRDSTRKFKLVGIMKAGTEHTLGGEPPYNVVIGNARGVELLVNGKPYDLASRTRGNVARFTLKP